MTSRFLTTTTSITDAKISSINNVIDESINKLTTKGDLLTFDTTTNNLSVGFDGQILIADSTQTKGIKWGTLSLSTTLSSLTDCNISSPSNGNVLKYNSSISKWVNDASSGDSLSSLTDVTISNIANKQTIVYDSGTSKYINSSLTIDYLTDFNISIPACINNQLLQYDKNTSKFLNKTLTKNIKTIIYKNVDYTITKDANNYINVGYVFVNTTSNIVTITLPTNCISDTRILIKDQAGTFNTHNCTIGLQGDDSISQSAILSVNNKCSMCVYNKTSGLWTITNIPNDYTLLTMYDNFIEVDSSNVAMTIYLPVSPSTGTFIQIKDIGSCATNNITINGTGYNIDGSTTYIMKINKSCCEFVYNGTSWDIKNDKNPMTTKGDILAFSTETVRIPVSSNGNFLVCNSVADSGLSYVNGLTTKGDILGFDSGYNRLPVGTNTQVLTCDSSTALGIKWSTPTAQNTSLSNLTTDVNITTPVTNNILYYTSSKWTNIAGLTTKGDILTYSTTPFRLSVGTDGQIFMVDSAQTTGNKWITCNTTKGDLLGFDTTIKRIPIGTNNYSLIADSTQTLGLKWGQLALNSATTYFSDINCSAIANKDILRYNTATSKFENSPSLTTLETSVSTINTTVTTTCNIYKSISATQNITQLINYDDVVMSEPMAYVNNSTAQLYTPIHCYVFGSSSDASIAYLYGSGNVGLSQPLVKRISYDFVNTSFSYTNIYVVVNATICDFSVYGTNDANQFTSNDTTFASGNLTLLGGPTRIPYGNGSNANIVITNTNTYRYLIFKVDTTAGSYGANIDTIQVTIAGGGLTPLYTGTNISITNDTTGNPLLTYLDSSSATVVMDYNKVALYRLCKTVFPVCRSLNSIYLKTDGTGNDYSIINHNGLLCKYDNASTYTALIQGISTLNDTTITSIANNDMLVYTTSSNKWVNSAIPINKLAMIHNDGTYNDGISMSSTGGTSTISIDANGWTNIKESSYTGENMLRVHKNGVIQCDVGDYRWAFFSFGSTLHIVNYQGKRLMSIDKGCGDVTFSGTVAQSAGVVDLSSYLPTGF